MEKENTIHRGMTIDQIISLFPHKAAKLSQEITNAGLHCIGCGAATWETLEGGMYGHGMNDAQIDGLVDRLNALLNEEVPDGATITLTKRAADKFLAVLKMEGKQGFALRILEKKAGCSGFQYVLDTSESPKPTDRVFESLGIKIHVDEASVQHLLGSEIDYLDGLQGAGFKVSNPNVRKSCGCGNSHGY